MVELTDMNLKVKNVAKMVSSTKRNYEWSFKARILSDMDHCMWKEYSVLLIDSTLSKKRTLKLNNTVTLIDKTVMPNFAETPHIVQTHPFVMYL